jgi:hypothetical protein
MVRNCHILQMPMDWMNEQAILLSYLGIFKPFVRNVHQIRISYVVAHCGLLDWTGISQEATFFIFSATIENMWQAECYTFNLQVSYKVGNVFTGCDRFSRNTFFHWLNAFIILKEML